MKKSNLNLILLHLEKEILKILLILMKNTGNIDIIIHYLILILIKKPQLFHLFVKII